MDLNSDNQQNLNTFFSGHVQQLQTLFIHMLQEKKKKQTQKSVNITRFHRNPPPEVKKMQTQQAADFGIEHIVMITKTVAATVALITNHVTQL